jgi:hypothetical protein
VYRIKAPGLPTACLLKTHVEFSWNAQGPKGDKGDPGVAGNIALAGQSCPTSYFVAGFNATGGFICRNTNGDEPGGNNPPPPAPSALNGIWSLSPILVSSCTSFLGPGQFSITQLRTTVVASGELLIEPIGIVQFNGLSTQVLLNGTIVRISDPVAFPMQVSVVGNSVLTGTVSGTISYSLNGTIESLTSATASVLITPNTLNFAGSALVCTQVGGTVTGTKLA